MLFMEKFTVSTELPVGFDNFCRLSGSRPSAFNPASLGGVGSDTDQKFLM